MTEVAVVVAVGTKRETDLEGFEFEMRRVFHEFIESERPVRTGPER